MSDLKITMQQQDVYIDGVTQGFRIKVIAEAEYPDLIPDDKIFLYARTVPSPETGEIVDRFIAVCSPLDMEEYPADNPDMTRTPHFYRLNEIDLVHTSQTILLECWEDIKKDIHELVETLKNMQTLSTGEEIEYEV